MKKIIILLILSVVLAFSACSTSENMTSDTYFILDTVVSIKIYNQEDAQKIINECFNICKKYDSMFNKNNPNSDIGRINNAKSETVEVDYDTVELLEKALVYAHLSDGAYDPTIGVITELWDFQTKNPTIPTDNQIQQMLIHVNYKEVEIIGKTVTLNDPLMKIDLGGIAKGYITDKIVEYLISVGVKSAIVDLGGNIYVIGDNNGSKWQVGIQKPFAVRGETVKVLNLTDISMVTSGNYERYFEIDNKIYHHILDPKTGYPVENGINSVSIIAQNSCDADALSTACFVLGTEKGKDLALKFSNIQAIFVKSDNELDYTLDSEKYFVKTEE